MLLITNLHGTTKRQSSSTDHNRSFSPKLLYPCTKIHTGQPFQVGPELSKTTVHGDARHIRSIYSSQFDQTSTGISHSPIVINYTSFRPCHLDSTWQIDLYIFTKIMDCPLQTLRMQGVNIMTYLDDIALWQTAAETQKTGPAHNKQTDQNGVLD